MFPVSITVFRRAISSAWNFANWSPLLATTSKLRSASRRLARVIPESSGLHAELRQRHDDDLLERLVAVEGQRLAVVRDRTVLLSRCTIGGGAVLQIQHAVGIEPNGLVIVRDGFRILPLAEIDVAAVVVGAGAFRIEPDRFARSRELPAPRIGPR